MGTDHAEVDPLMLWSVEMLEERFADIRTSTMCLLYCTAPLRDTADIEGTLSLLGPDGFDSALSLCEKSSYLWERTGDSFRPTNYDPLKRAARQTENWNQFEENKAVYAFRVAGLLKTGCRLHGRIGGYLMPTLRSIDIDDIHDFEIAEAIAKNGSK